MTITNIYGVFTFVIVPMILFPIALFIYGEYENSKKGNKKSNT